MTKSRLIPMQCVVVLQYNASDSESVIDLHDIIATLNSSH